MRLQFANAPARGRKSEQALHRQPPSTVEIVRLRPIFLLRHRSSLQPVSWWSPSLLLPPPSLLQVELFNGKAGLVEGSIERKDRSGLDLVACENPRLVHFCGTEWHVYAAFGTLKGGRADWLVEKCTELGASSIAPLLMDRSPSISENWAERLQRVVVAASKQCQWLHETILNPPLHINDIKSKVAQSKLTFVATAEATPILSVLTTSIKESKGSLIVGPEGDFTEKELKTMIELGAAPVGLGSHRLHVETATVALLAAAILWSDSHG